MNITTKKWEMTEKTEESQGSKFDRYWIKDIELAYDCKKQSMWMT